MLIGLTIAYVVGALAMAALIIAVIINDRDQIDGWHSGAAFVVMVVLWPFMAAWIAVAAWGDWRHHRDVTRDRRRRAWRPAYRWSDNDRRWWRFIYARNHDSEYRPFGIVLSSRGGDDETDEQFNTLRLSARGRTLIVILPQMIRPWKKWRDVPRSYGDRGQRFVNGYWDTGPREYGFTISNGYLSVALGRVTNDSSTEQRWGWFFPWSASRFVRFSLYGLSGEHVWSQFQKDRPKGPAWSSGWFDQQRVVEDACPAMTFEFHDSDGEPLSAVTRIQEREWRLGERGWQWLSWFASPKVRRSLDIRYSGEVGNRKGSWKGGTISTGIDMLPGELHEAAFRRHCAKNALQFVEGSGTSATVPPQPEVLLDPGSPAGAVGHHPV